MATEKQIAFINKLRTERDPRTFSAPLVSVLNAVINGQDKKGQASWVIESLLSMPKAPSFKKFGESKPTITATPGYYLLDSEVYTVVKSKEHEGRVYAKRLVIEGGKGKWEFAKGVIAKLTPSTRLTVEQAKALGHKHGVCCVCGRTLTDPSSVEAGIGPVCETKLGF